ncbi:MAG: phosphoribosylformylglycinamidine synthase subunit PurQ, partial [Armatimonadota bacterium]|nr:phosphoribosylformylglycinamidine synthase subunit PurQ [Armatimonadota bacterium]
AGLLPGALLHNRTLRFVCRDVWVRTECVRTPFTRGLRPGQVLRLPVAHAEGRYLAPPPMLRALERKRQVVFRYCDPAGRVRPRANPNGSARAIAAVCNAAGNVVGMMPHPERAAEGVLGSEDGRSLFESALRSLAGE